MALRARIAAQVSGEDQVDSEDRLDGAAGERIIAHCQNRHLRASYRALCSPLREGETLDSDWPWKFPDTMKFEAAHAVEGIDPRAINRGFGMSNLNLESMKAAFAANMFPLLEQAERIGHFDIVDYQDRADIITNMSLYADIYHCNERITEELVHSACTGDALLTRQNFEKRTRSLLHLVQSTDPVAIVKEARGSR